MRKDTVSIGGASGFWGDSVTGPLQLVASGYTSAEIGGRLAVSMQTVNTHIKNIYRKLHVRTRAQAVNLASRRNWML